jgi:PKHD-type hydroxylase
LVKHNYYPLYKEENYKHVICVESFFSKEELLEIHKQLQNVNVTAAVVGSQKVETDEQFEELRKNSLSVRKSNVSFLDFSWDWLYLKLSEAVLYANSINYNKTLYGMEPLQYTEYDSKYKGFYGPHIDETRSYTGLKRSLSFSMQLSEPDSYEGGDVVIYNGETSFHSNRSYGSITFFDSNLMHEVMPVTSGFRKSLVGWVLGPRV